MDRRDNDIFFFTESLMQEGKAAEELIGTMNQHYRDAEQRKPDLKKESKNAVCVRACVCLLLLKCTCLFVFEIVTLHWTHSYVGL